MCAKMVLENIIPRGNAMYTQIEENIYSIFVPLPENPLKNLNAYFIRGEGGRNLLIDTGFRRDECREALLEGLSGLGARMEDTDICLTHLHSDHTGLASELAAPGAKIYISREDGTRLEQFRQASNSHRIDEYARLGFSEQEIAFLKDSPMRKYNAVKKADFTFIGEGDVLEYGGRRLRVISTPGHTPGHVCLYDRENKAMFLGDHVLFDITPNITTWPGFEDPLGKYVHSLMDISIFDVRLPLPAHRGVKGTMAERIGAIIEHHGVRIREMLDILTREPGLTAYELSGRMTWRVRGKSPSWADFPLQQKWFAVGETAAHLEYLTVRGRAYRKPEGGVWRYYT